MRLLIISGLVIAGLLLLVSIVSTGVMVGVWLVVVRSSVSFVSDISNITGIAIDVIVNVLLATVGQDDVVVAGCVVTIASLVLAHVHVRVVVVDSPIELVVSGGL